jgi:hypothetical protein
VPKPRMPKRLSREGIAVGDTDYFADRYEQALSVQSSHNSGGPYGGTYACYWVEL